MEEVDALVVRKRDSGFPPVSVWRSVADGLENKLGRQGNSNSLPAGAQHAGLTH